MLLIAASRGLKPARDVALDVLDHDDGVVDHDADRQHQAEQRQIVEREAERRHEEEGADQRHRNGDQRDDRRAPGLQEQHDHQHDQDDRLADRLLHGVDRLLDELGRIVDDVVFDARAETAWTMSAMVARIACAVASAFEPGRWNIAIATAGSRLR